MNTPHTPGKWQSFTRYVLCNGRFLATAHAIGDTGHGAGFKEGQEPTQDMNEAIANARLLASAPTLLSQRNELRQALNDIEQMLTTAKPIDYKRDCIKAFQMAQAALARTQD